MRLGGDAVRGVDAFGLDVSACPEDVGWSYDPDSASCSTGELVFTTGARPDPDAVIYLECLCER